MKIQKSFQALGDVKIDEFLSVFWQQKALVIRQVFSNFQSPIDANELAGLALDEDVNSRLIIEKTDKRWSVEHGPLPEDIFSNLPESHWTLLVQNVDSLDPRVNNLLRAFRFIPNWRLDDIMISYAADQGSVGPHFDYYDVFLLQAQGKRRWKLGQKCDASTPLLPDQNMKILADFNQQEEHVLEPGDMLYIPPGIAHWGIAEGECMTISVGFRAPSHAELLLEVAQERASQLTEDQRYRDSKLKVQSNPGEIKAEVVESLMGIMSELSSDPESLADIFGRMMTRRNSDVTYSENTANTASGTVRLSPYARCAWYKANKGVLCFINGESWACSRDLALLLSTNKPINTQDLSGGDLAVLHELSEAKLLDHICDWPRQL